jgi:hypothetical protein
VQHYRTDALRPVMHGAHDWQQHCTRYTPAYIQLVQPLPAGADYEPTVSGSLPLPPSL